MAISYILGYNPFWILIDRFGLTAGGGSLHPYSNLNKTQAKPVYMDPAGLFPWPTSDTNGILFGENGVQGPFYFSFDSGNPTQSYYLEAYDADNNLLWTINNYNPGANSGGGPAPITSVIDLNNYIVNNVFWRNIGTSARPIPSSLTIAPSVHENVQTPDITFIKNSGSTADDQITFKPFALGSTPYNASDVSNEFYLNYRAYNSPSGETYKYHQFPIVAHLQNLSNTEVVVAIWARVNSPSTSTLTLQFQSFYGDGGGSATSQAGIGVCSLTTSWQQFVFPVVTPNPSGNSIGVCGNDTLYVTVNYPLNVEIDIDFSKPKMYLGDTLPEEELATYDQVNSIISAYRTGDVRTSINSYLFGYVAADDGTIGNAGSLATNRANVDTFPLYQLIYNAVADTYAPVVGGRTGNAVNDFVANKPITLTRTLGRVMAGALPLQALAGVPQSSISQTFTASSVTNQLTVGSTTNFWTGVPVTVSNSGGALPTPLVANTTYYAINLTSTTLELATSPENAIAGTFISLTSNGTGTNTVTVPAHVLGSYLGEETHKLTIAEMPNHRHTYQFPNTAVQKAGASSNVYNADVPLTTGNTSFVGGDGSHNTMQPTVFYNVFIKL